MKNELNAIFNEDSANAVASSRSLEGTAQLTSTATAIANEIMATIENDFASWKEAVEASKVSHNDMDALITACHEFTSDEYDFIQELTDDVVEKMLKSQQSKRSRAKGNTMTLDNYRTMLIGGVAEQLLRVASGKDKSSAGFKRTAGNVEFSEEQLAALKANQDDLRKEIRNVQSKKSIMKSKADYDPESDRWLQLLKAEAQLKALRTGSVSTIVEVDTTKNSLKELFGDIDPSKLSKAELQELLTKTAGLVD